MVILDHENLPKTRRAILIVCVLIIAIENYLSISKPEVNFGGAKLSVSKDDLTGGLFTGLFYLWFVAIAQFLKSSSVSKFLNVLTNLGINKVKDKSYKGESFGGLFNTKNTQLSIKIAKVQRKFDLVAIFIQVYNQSIFWFPFIGLSLFVVYKYHGFSITWSTITKIVS